MEYGHGNGSDWCVIAQSNTTSEPESVNHQQDKNSNARFNGKKKDEPVLTASHVFKEHPLEIKQEDEVPELATAHWQYFGLRHQPEIGLVNSMFWVKTHCLEVLSSE